MDRKPSGMCGDARTAEAKLDRRRVAGGAAPLAMLLPLLLFAALAGGAGAGERGGASAGDPGGGGRPRSSPTPSPRAGPEETPPTVYKRSRRARVGDVVVVRVFGHPELSSQGRVEADGRLALALGGRIVVLGLTEAQLEEKAAVALGRAARMAKLSVRAAFETRKTGQVYFLGAVAHPSAVVLPQGKRMTLSQALAMVGGFASGAEQRRVRILRRDPAGALREVLEVNVESLSMAGSAEDVRAVAEREDPVLEDGDTIVVGIQRQIYIMGRVAQPGGYWPPPGERLTLARAIARAGGFTETAKRTTVRIVRTSAEGKIQRIIVDVRTIQDGRREDVAVLPGDMIYVPESMW